MKLNETEILKLLPEFMRSDEANKALAKAIDMIAIDACGKIRTVSIWDQIDKLDDATLDELAYELGIGWYKSTADIATKREIIKASDIVHAKLGTPWAVEKLMTDYFGSAVVREWWIYAGKPGHFKLLSTNPELTNSRIREALALLKICQRESSIIDDIGIVLTGDQQLYAGMAVHDWTIETTTFGDTDAIAAEAAALAT